MFQELPTYSNMQEKNARQGLQDQSFLFSEYLFQSTLEIRKLGKSDEVQENYIKLDQESVVEPGFQSSSSSSSYLKNLVLVSQQ